MKKLLQQIRRVDEQHVCILYRPLQARPEVFLGLREQATDTRYREFVVFMGTCPP